MLKIDIEAISREIEVKTQQKNELFGKEFLNEFIRYLYTGDGINKVGAGVNNLKLFKFHSNNIKPIFEYREKETEAEKGRHKDSTYGVYYFNNFESWHPIRIEISISKKDVPSSLKNCLFNNKKPTCLIDIEFFEKPLLENDSKNNELIDFIKEYAIDGRLTKDDLTDLGNLMALEDLEKIHIKFLVFDNKYLIDYLGIGTNQPFSIGEKGELGKNRFYRYSLERNFEQRSKVKEVGQKIRFKKEDIIFPEESSDGNVYALFPDVGVIVKRKKSWKKACICNYFTTLDRNGEFKKYRGINFIQDKLTSLFPVFDGYQHVFYDPFEKVNSFGHVKIIKYLKKKELLGMGWQSKLNVASDLWKNGYDDVFRIKPISLLLYHFIEIGELKNMIENQINDNLHIPIKNN